MSTAKKPWIQIALGIVAGTIASGGIAAVTSGGFALSFDAIRTVARAAHINVDLDWMLPVTIDGAMAVASVTAIVLQRMGRKPWYPWIVVLANVLISVGCNALHAYQGGGEQPLPGGWAMAVSAIPALNLALSLHLAIELVMAVVKRNEKSAEGDAAKVRFAQFAPTPVRSDSHRATPEPTQPVRTEGRPRIAPSLSAVIAAPSLNGSQSLTQRATQTAVPTPTQTDQTIEKPAATVAEQAAEKRTEKVAAKPESALRKPAYPLADDPNESVRKLARAYSRNPAKTNAELAKLAKVSEGTANRYMPKVRQSAVAAENGDADEERALSALTLGPFTAPTPHALKPVNGYSRTTPEETK